jgi:hypothetical protein
MKHPRNLHRSLSGIRMAPMSLLGSEQNKALFH